LKIYITTRKFYGRYKMTIDEKKLKVQTFIDKLEKDNEGEDRVRRELANDSATLEAIDDMVNNGESLPSNSPYLGFIQWRELVEKQIGASEKNLLKFSEQKLEIEFYQFYLDNVA
ncbi:MAG: hypothetical protein ACRC0G_03805, partial [Fusobacteriaceae bacterium]